ncbi:DUF4347 domain-containing protein [Rhodovarius crocodyli]|uniref:DUF4347 domain-containing protein n=1 Tax=Rhodovarius crocodyli TaxID=1979269 RepID=A0A437MJ22_9PROT|nr:DUF4347 domain-containing protein [Rhodovarius crocodyli]RVT97642.1 DUF4347 domain-containing protein [Rhodovarius crocodyli]
MATMVIHDRRLTGDTPAWYSFVMQVNNQTGIRHITETVARRARQKRKLTKLHILCHGYENNWDLGSGMCVPAAHGGFGLQLGREGLNLFNYGLTSTWKGLVDEIVLFACAPADTYAGNVGTWGDGKRFCGYLALTTGAKVIAARDTQIYHYGGGGPIDFGAWEGPVYEYSDANPEGTRILDPSRYHVHGSRQAAAA